MPPVNRRDFLKYLSATATAGSLPFMHSAQAHKVPDKFYHLPMQGDARILHTTDIHGQLFPVYFREPNVNLGVGKAYARPPHIVGKQLLNAMGLPLNGPESYAYTYIDFYKQAKRYGKTGGFAHIKTLLDQLRQQAGGKHNTLTIDSGDLWQGSATSLWTRGIDMVEASNILGLDIMIGHWEFTYKEQEVLSNISLFKGDFIGQNVRVKEDALFDEQYANMVEQYDGRGLYDEDSGHAFKPYVMKVINDARIAVVGQAFPRTANANPQEFFPDWSFGLREDDMSELVEEIRSNEKPDAVVLLSHNGMDVDIKMAERVSGLDAIFGGHTHDGIPKPLKVNNPSGRTCYVTNAGSNGKYVGVMDFALSDKGGLDSMHYKMLPVISNWLPADKEMNAYLKQMRSTIYNKKIVESRNSKYAYNKNRLGKTYDSILKEKLAIADRNLYRRGNFMGTWDQILCNALRHEYAADIALSAGVRWGTSLLKGDWITMEDVMAQCAMTYAETYVANMTGKELIAVLEGVADNLFEPDPYLQSGGDMVRVGGLNYSIDPNNKVNHRISNVTLDNGQEINPERSYKVAGWASVNRTPEGRLMWDVARDYILTKRDAKTGILHLAKINHPNLINVLPNPGIADYSGYVS